MFFELLLEDMRCMRSLERSTAHKIVPEFFNVFDPRFVLCSAGRSLMLEKNCRNSVGDQGGFEVCSHEHQGRTRRAGNKSNTTGVIAVKISPRTKTLLLQGIEETQRAASVLRGLGVNDAFIWADISSRAQDTARILAEELNIRQVKPGLHMTSSTSRRS